MTANADLILQGPRGRRLCLELAMALDQDVRTAASLLASELENGPGTSRVLLTSVSTAGGPPAPPTAPSPVELAAMLAALDLKSTGTEHMQAALERSVDSARYWQEPDGEDRLAGLPVITVALSAVAERFLTADGPHWWWQPRQIQQWAIHWRSADDPAPLPRNPRQTLKEWARKERAEEEQAVRERPSDPHANLSGAWWSIPHGLVHTIGQVPAGLSLVEDSLGWEQAAGIPVRGAGRTLEIRTAGDWITLCRRFPFQVSASRRHDWFRATGRHGRWVIPDWEQVADEWDAVHLTVLGYLNGATRALRVDDDTATVIAGWDPDSTIWLTDVAREWEGPRQIWHRAPQGDRWSRLRP